jgi:plastocyanin
MDSIQDAPRKRRLAQGALLLVAAGLVLGGCASRGSVAGRVHPPSPDTVVQAWPGKEKAPRAPADTARVVQTKGRFEPRVLAVQSGAIIEFVNEDRVYHNAFCLAPKGRFDIGRYRPGQVRRTSFEHPGEYEVFCELHPAEVLYVVVATQQWNTNAGRDGSFLLAHLPRGEYVLRAWNPRLGSATMRVTVPAKEAIRLNLRG